MRGFDEELLSDDVLFRSCAVWEDLVKAEPSRTGGFIQWLELQPRAYGDDAIDECYEVRTRPIRRIVSQHRMPKKAWEDLAFRKGIEPYIAMKLAIGARQFADDDIPGGPVAISGQPTLRRWFDYFTVDNEELSRWERWLIRHNLHPWRAKDDLFAVYEFAVYELEVRVA